jgi:zinc-binding alcohol dehydrogenase family protein
MAEMMRAVGYRKPLPVSDPASLEDLEVPVPGPGPRDLLVRVEAVSVNPVDVKVRASTDPGSEPKILGYDAAGVVVATGPEVTLFSPGDEVYYAGSIDRPGTDAQFHLVDERITGHKPRSLDFGQAAALPLTTITAWESLFDRLRLNPESSGVLLVLGAAGGVGSMVTQLARALTRMVIIGTASRPESQQWVLDHGAHHVIGHHDLAQGVRGVSPDGVTHIFSAHTAGSIGDFAEILQPYGAVVAIDDPQGLDIYPLKNKSIAFDWEFMFTRPLYQPVDMVEQHQLLDRVAEMIDEGTIRTTLSQRLGPINAATLREAHGLVEQGRMVGKAVVAGW